MECFAHPFQFKAFFFQFSDVCKAFEDVFVVTAYEFVWHWVCDKPSLVLLLQQVVPIKYRKFYFYRTFWYHNEKVTDDEEVQSRELPWYHLRAGWDHIHSSQLWKWRRWHRRSNESISFAPFFARRHPAAYKWKVWTLYNNEITRWHQATDAITSRQMKLQCFEGPVNLV